LTLSYTQAFQRQLKRLARKYRRIRVDIEPILDQIEAGDMPGDQVTGIGATVFKVRAPNQDAQRGSSGGYRIIYYLQTSNDIVLLTIYSKIEQADISAHELQAILQEAGLAR